jgi:hypothetical protein|tara:strand:- start:1114 stop:1635 length:522 start_codon:yes stop_codon:yes gene_type:complete
MKYRTRKQKEKEKVPRRYIPKRLSRKDTKKQRNMLKKSRKMYKQGKYYTRKRVPSFTSKVSPHVVKARKIYNIESIKPSRSLAVKTGCSKQSLEKIVSKGRGAYFSSGSRPNQTGESWGIARLASAITSGKAAAIDYNILEKGCRKNSKALHMAKMSRKKYGYGNKSVAKVEL